MQDPVNLNGFVYDREFIEDWIFENDWTDPGRLTSGSRSDSIAVSPDDITDCSEDFLILHRAFVHKFSREIGTSVTTQ